MYCVTLIFCWWSTRPCCRSNWWLSCGEIMEVGAVTCSRFTWWRHYTTSPTKASKLFSVAGPRLWNSLPAEIKKTCCIVTLKRLLKIHLFRTVHEIWTSVRLFFYFIYLLSYTCITLILHNVILIILLSIYHLF